jgi:hypothetical protein
MLSSLLSTFLRGEVISKYQNLDLFYALEFFVVRKESVRSRVEGSCELNGVEGAKDRIKPPVSACVAIAAVISRRPRYFPYARLMLLKRGFREGELQLKRKQPSESAFKAPALFSPVPPARRPLNRPWLPLPARCAGTPARHGAVFRSLR